MCVPALSPAPFYHSTHIFLRLFDPEYISTRFCTYLVSNTFLRSLRAAMRSSGSAILASDTTSFSWMSTVYLRRKEETTTRTETGKEGERGGERCLGQRFANGQIERCDKSLPPMNPKAPRASRRAASSAVLRSKCDPTAIPLLREEDSCSRTAPRRVALGAAGGALQRRSAAALGVRSSVAVLPSRPISRAVPLRSPRHL